MTYLRKEPILWIGFFHWRLLWPYHSCLDMLYVSLYQTLSRLSCHTCRLVFVYNNRMCFTPVSVLVIADNRIAEYSGPMHRVKKSASRTRHQSRMALRVSNRPFFTRNNRYSNPNRLCHTAMLVNEN